MKCLNLLSPSEETLGKRRNEADLDEEANHRFESSEYHPRIAQSDIGAREEPSSMK